MCIRPRRGCDVCHVAQNVVRSATCYVVHVFFAVAGGLIVLAVMIDVIWTAIGTHGGGPITKRLTQPLWHGALWMHQRSGRKHHGALSFVGSVVLLAIVVCWVVMTLAGWVLIFSASPNAIVDARTRQPADLGGRIFYVAYSISTMGNGDFQPVTTLWRVLTSVMTLSGITFVTLSVTFILSVLSAVVEMRSLGAMISDMGGTPEGILRRAWDGERFDGLENFLLQLTGAVHVFIEQHLAYPVLQYFHSESRRTSAPLRLSALHDLMIFVEAGAAEPARIGRMKSEPLLDALAAFAEMATKEVAHERGEIPPLPELDLMRSIGIPSVSDEEFRAALKGREKTRRGLYAVLLHDGWVWEEATRT